MKQQHQIPTRVFLWDGLIIIIEHLFFFHLLLFFFFIRTCPGSCFLHLLFPERSHHFLRFCLLASILRGDTNQKNGYKVRSAILIKEKFFLVNIPILASLSMTPPPRPYFVRRMFLQPSRRILHRQIQLETLQIWSIEQTPP